MQSIRPHVERPGGRCRYLCLVLLLSCAAPVCADEADAFNFFVGSNVTHDDNVFRLPADSTAEIIPGSRARADTITMSYAGGSFRKTLGRQRVWLDLNLNQSRYARFGLLDFDGHSAGMGADWRLTDLLGGRIGKTRSLQMAGFADIRRNEQNLYTNESEFFSADMWLMADWHLEGELRRTTLDYDKVANRTNNRIEDSRRLGVRYTPRSGNFVLLRVTRTDGRLPNQEVLNNILIDNSYEQEEIATEFTAAVSGQSQLRGAIGETRRQHRNVPERDFSGMTGYLAWDWAPSGKLRTVARVRREIGGANDLLSSYFLTNAINVGINWQATAKTSVSLSYERSRRNYAGDPVAFLSGLEDRLDRIRSASLGVNYQPFRSLLLSCSLSHSERDSNVAGLPFVATSTMLGAQFSF